MRNIFKYGLLAMAIAVTSVGVRAQDIPVSGVVKDKSNNSTLPYASVIVKNESEKRCLSFQPQLMITDDSLQKLRVVTDLYSLSWRSTVFQSKLLNLQNACKYI